MNKYCRFSLLAALFAGSLAGCASHPDSLVLSPVSVDTKVQAQSKASLSVSATDHRIETFLVRINREGEAAELVNAGTNPRQLVEQALANGLAKQGYHVGNEGAVQMTMTLEQLLVDVDQETMNHTARSRAAANLVITQGERRLSKRYQAKGELTGVLQADPAQLEKVLNERVSQLVDAILNDPELHQFIQ